MRLTYEHDEDAFGHRKNYWQAETDDGYYYARESDPLAAVSTLAIELEDELNDLKKDGVVKEKVDVGKSHNHDIFTQCQANCPYFGTMFQIGRNTR